MITTKRAYEDLESEGWVVGRTGRGTEVADLSDEFLERRKRELVGVKLTEARELALTLGLDRTMIEEAWKQLWEDS